MRNGYFDIAGYKHYDFGDTTYNNNNNIKVVTLI